MLLLLLLLYMDISVGDNIVVADAVVVMDISVGDNVGVAAVVVYGYLCCG